jgi:hypothetical protein
MTRSTDSLRGAVALIAFGIATTAVGIYFMALRPALLPEDLRFAHLQTGDVPAPLLPWLRIVFRTWGGFVVGLGVLLLGQGIAAYTNRSGWSRCGTAIGVVFAFGSFLVSNIQLGSDFLWFIGLMFAFALAVAGIVLRGSTDG